jgi:hypothetical protein
MGEFFGEFFGPFYPPPPPRPFLPKLIGPPSPDIFARAKRAKASKFAREERIKICALTFETCRSSDVYNYMIFFIIIGHRSNKIQSLLDNDDFFSFFFKKTQIYFYFLFF